MVENGGIVLHLLISRFHEIFVTSRPCCIRTRLSIIFRRSVILLRRAIYRSNKLTEINFLPKRATIVSLIPLKERQIHLTFSSYFGNYTKQNSYSELSVDSTSTKRNRNYLFISNVILLDLYMFLSLTVCE